jgi:Transcriptional regulator, AbiEi antitoxin
LSTELKFPYSFVSSLCAKLQFFISFMADPIAARRRLQALAMRQGGYFTSGQAREAGYSHQSQKYHADRGSWARVDRGLFRLPDWPERAEDVYVRWRLWSRDEGVVSHQSALSLHRLGDVNPVLVHLTVPRRFRASDPAVALHRGALPPGDVEEREPGFRLTTPERSLLDAAAAELTQDQLDGAVVDAVDEGLVLPRRLRERSDEFGDLAALRLERALSRMGR